MIAKILQSILYAAMCVSLPSQIEAVGFGQVDTFQDGTTMSWSEGASSPNPPTNVGDGGPAGTGDHYLENISTGGSGAGSKMIMFNSAQWTGNFVGAGVDRITAYMANFGSTTLYMRVALQSTTGTTYGSSSAFVLPPDAIWRVVDFDLTPAGLTNIFGADTLAQALSNVTEMRILSAIGGASFSGDPTAGTLGTDNIIARDIANFILRLTNVSIISGVPRVSFTTLGGRTHRVEQRSSLASGDWSPVGSVTGTGGVVQVDDTAPGAGSQVTRFYRVVLLPP